MQIRATIYHNPDCQTSRNTLGIIRNAGIEPAIIDYRVQTPPRKLLVEMIKLAGLTVRQAIREKDTPYHALGLDNPHLSDDELVDAMLEHPILINRPFVVTPWGVRLSRPSETVLEILPLDQMGQFAKEDGEAVIDENGNRII